MSGSLVSVESGQIRVLPSFADMLVVAAAWRAVRGRQPPLDLARDPQERGPPVEAPPAPRTTPEFDALLVPPEPQPEVECATPRPRNRCRSSCR